MVHPIRKKAFEALVSGSAILKEGHAAKNAIRSGIMPKESHGHGHGHGHGSHGSANESFGKGFYIPLAAIPVGYVLYQLSQSATTDKSVITRIIDKYTEKHEELNRRNALHTTMKEEAGRDRFLFLHSKSELYVDMKFPEMMNVGSPYNVVAGSQVNMDKVIAKFKAEANADNEMKLERLRNNEVPSEQPLERVLGSRRFRGVQLDPKEPGGVEYEKQRLNAAIR